MVGDVTAISGFCIAGAVLAVLLKQYCKEQSMFVALGVCVFVLLGAITIISPLIEKTETLFIKSGISSEYIVIVFKATAICFITQITSDLCRDSEESAIATAVELWGRIAITVMSLPLIESLTEIIIGLL